MSAATKRARDRFLADMDKSFGQGVAKIKTVNDYEVIPTGSLALDRAMSVGGYLIGRLTEIWGPPGGGKSSLSLIGAANAQAAYPDRDVIYVDAEHTYDPEWAATLGADPDRIIQVDPLHAENVADMVKLSILSDTASMVIIDSIGAVLTNNEFAKAADESDMGKRAQVVSRMINIAAGLAPRHKVAVIVLNQARANFGYGADVKPSGGFVPAHSMTHRLHVKRASSAYTTGTDEAKVNIGYEMGVKVERNKVGPEGRNVKFDFYTVGTAKHPVGIDREQDVFNAALRSGLIPQAGAYYTLGEERVQGKDAAFALMKANPSILDTLRSQLLAKVSGEVVVDQTPELTAKQAKDIGIT